ncbi:MAG: ferredoxin [Bacilli bacterium]|nr:ferredoxin [Bacilli bacterium]
MKVKVNQEACIGCGACQAIADEVFEINDEGLSEVKVETVDDDKKEQTLEAIDSCPTSAIEEVKEEKKEN